MAITWAWRADSSSLNARYTETLAAPFVFNNTVSSNPQMVVDAGMIGGYRLTCDAYRPPVYLMGNAFKPSPAFSVLIRGKFSDITGSGLLLLQTGLYLWQAYFTGGGNLFFNFAKKDTTGTHISFITASPLSITLGNETDIVFTCPGTDGSDFKLYQDGSLLETQSWTTDAHTTDDLMFARIGVHPSNGTMSCDLTEAVFWNEVIDPTSVGLVSGTGSLNGDSRTSFVDVTNYEAFAVPSASIVKTGEVINGTTGTYDGSDRWTDPGEANVRAGTSYKANSLTENKTGTLESTNVYTQILDVELAGGPLTAEVY